MLYYDRLLSGKVDIHCLGIRTIGLLNTIENHSFIRHLLAMWPWRPPHWLQFYLLSSTIIFSWFMICLQSLMVLGTISV